MAKTPELKGSSPQKIAGGAVLLVASVALLIHRIPQHQYVEVHADAPRPAPGGEDSTPSFAVPAAAVPTAAARPVVMPAAPPPSKAAALAPAPAPAPAPAAAPPAKVEPVDLTYECRSEAALLCYHVPDRGLARCLREYRDALMRPCRAALKSGQVPAAAVVEEEEQ
jgi:hypothetical protein